MSSFLKIVEDLSVGSPCSEKLAKKNSNCVTLDCNKCCKPVYDISQLTRIETLLLFISKKGDLCVRLKKDSNGKILFDENNFTSDLKGFNKFFVKSGLAALIVACLPLKAFADNDSKKAQPKSFHSPSTQVHLPICAGQNCNCEDFINTTQVFNTEENKPSNLSTLYDIPLTVIQGDSKIPGIVETVLEKAEGAFGASFMVITALCSAAFTVLRFVRKRRVYLYCALTFGALALAAFTIRLLISIYFPPVY